MKQGLFRSKAAAGVAALVALMAAPAGANAAAGINAINWSALSTQVNPMECVAPPFSQPFLAWKDRNFYTLAPGQQPGDFVGTGWVLGGGAKLVTTTLANGQTSQVLDLPAGGTAVSPPMCVTAAYPSARTMIREPGKGAGVQMYVTYTSRTGSGWDSPIATGTVQAPGSAWSASNVANIHPGKYLGWQEARFGFVGAGTDNQIYDFYVDPHMRY